MKRFFGFLGKILDRAEEWSNLVGTWLIVVLMLLITSDVVVRTTTGASIVGAFEFTELVIVGIVFLPTAYTQRQKGHITMDLIVSRLRGKTAQNVEIFALLLSFVISTLIFFQTAVEAQIALDIHLTTAGVIKWPASPLKIALAFGFFLLCIRIGVQLTQQIRLRIGGR